MTQIDRWLARIAPALQALKALTEVTVSYDLFSDALKWSDETPACFPENAEACNCLRGLWRYRTSLILGQPQDRHRELWGAALRAFPEWPGFLPERRDPSLKPVYEAAAKKSLGAWEAIGEQGGAAAAEIAKL